jgi:ATP-dependent helicase/DNAse subunit B
MEPSKTILLSYPILQAKPSTHLMCAQDHLFHTHEHKVFIDNQMSQNKYNYYINNVHQRLKQLSRSRTAEGSKHHSNSNQSSASLELLIEEFSITIF